MRRLLSVLSVLAVVACAPLGRYAVFSGFAQGGTYCVKANLAGVYVSPAEIQAAIDSILQTVDTTISGYNRGSMLSRFNAGQTVVPNELFADLYNLSRKLYDETGGAFNVAAAPLFDIWGFGFTADSLPPDDLVRRTLDQCDMSSMPDSIEAGKPLEADFKLNFNAIAQGYSCDLVAGYLRSAGVKDMLVDIGEIFMDGVNPSGEPWSIGVDKPIDGNNTPGAQIDTILRSDGGPHGIVTSGNYRKFYIRGGKKYAHTIDPRTGYPVSHGLLSATVIAPTGALADAYATYCMVIGPQAAREFLDSRDDLDGFLIY